MKITKEQEKNVIANISMTLCATTVDVNVLCLLRDVCVCVSVDGCTKWNDINDT